MPSQKQARFLDAARQDVVRLTSDNPAVGKLALETVRSLERSEIEGEPLNDMATTGDLGDCRKIKFGFGSPPSHRIVYREVGPDAGIEILEIVALEARNDLYAYLLAAHRLGRLPQVSKKQFGRVHQQAIKDRSPKR